MESQPVEQDGIAYFGGSSGYEYAVYMTNGTTLWKTFLGQADSDVGCGEASVYGVTSTATIAGDVLYVDGGYPLFYALNSSTGAVEWSAPIGTGTNSQGFYQWASPLIYNGDAYAGISSECDEPLVPAGLDEFSLSTHQLIGYFNTSVPEDIGSSIWGSPSVNPTTNTIFVATGNPLGVSVTKYGNSVIALNATTLALQANWQVPANEWMGDSDFGVTPTLFTPAGGYPMVTAADKNGILYAFYQSNLTLAWEQRICCEPISAQDEHISTAWGGGYVYAVGSVTNLSGVSVESSVTAFNPLNGNIVWQDALGEEAQGGYAAPLWVNNLLIVADARTILVMNATNGAVLYQDTIGGYFQAGPSISRGEILAGSTSGVYAFDLNLTSSAQQSVASGGPPLPDSFSVTGYGGLPPYQYSWNFGDGSSSSSQSPDHIFTTPGTYTVTVSVTDLAGNVSTDYLTVAVGAGLGSDVSFTESGLATSTAWSVGLDGVEEDVSSPTLVIDVPEGTYPYSVGPVSGFSPAPSLGEVVVSGSSLDVSVTFVPLRSVSFMESGLPDGVAWRVTLKGVPMTLIADGGTDSLTFQDASGTLPYVIAAVPGWGQSSISAAGTVVVGATPVTKSLVYTQVVSSVAFSESGLEAGITWNVTFNGVSQALSANGGVETLEFGSVPNGLYPYSIEVNPGYFEATVPYNGTKSVNGESLAVSMIYTPSVPTISVNRLDGPVGATFSVTGSRFGESTAATVSIDGVALATSDAADCTAAGSTITTDTSGGFVCTVTVPSLSPGPYTITGYDSATGALTATKTFTVTTPSISLSPIQGPVGSSVKVTGKGYSLESTEGLVFDGVVVSACSAGSLKTGGSGDFDCTIEVPSGTSGTSVIATDVGGEAATGSFTVTTPTITVNPKEGPVGATVKVSAKGFSVESAEGLVFDGITITSCSSGSLKTGGSGDFSCTLEVPSGTSGSSVVATDVGGEAATGSFEVTTPTIVVNPKDGPVGATVKVSGKGFSVDSMEQLVFDGVSINSCVGGSVTTGGSGDFACTFDVPGGTDGTSVVVTDISGQIATGSFTVTTPAVVSSEMRRRPPQ